MDKTAFLEARKQCVSHHHSIKGREDDLKVPLKEILNIDEIGHEATRKSVGTGRLIS